jgi:hypothetical protein
MYFGAWQSKDGFSGHEFHVGPHLMIVSPHQDDFQGFNRDPSNGMPYVAHFAPSQRAILGYTSAAMG